MYVVDEEELVVEGELVVGLVLRLLDVIRVLLQMFHVILVEMVDEENIVVLWSM